MAEAADQLLTSAVNIWLMSPSSGKFGAAASFPCNKNHKVSAEHQNVFKVLKNQMQCQYVMSAIKSLCWFHIGFLLASESVSLFLFTYFNFSSTVSDLVLCVNLMICFSSA